MHNAKFPSYLLVLMKKLDSIGDEMQYRLNYTVEVVKVAGSKALLTCTKTKKRIHPAIVPICKTKWGI